MSIATVEAVDKFRALLQAPDGLGASIETLKAAYERNEIPLQDAEITFVRVPPELHEKAYPRRYPVFHIYCDRIGTERKERFRRFSGTLRLVTEIRVSQDRLDGITESLHFYLDAVRDVVERRSGCLGAGWYLDGDYEAEIEAVKKGGVNYLQTARIACRVILNK